MQLSLSKCELASKTEQERFLPHSLKIINYKKYSDIFQTPTEYLKQHFSNDSYYYVTRRVARNSCLYQNDRIIWSDCQNEDGTKGSISNNEIPIDKKLIEGYIDQ